MVLTRPMLVTASATMSNSTAPKPSSRRAPMVSVVIRDMG